MRSWMKACVFCVMVLSWGGMTVASPQAFNGFNSAAAGEGFIPGDLAGQGGSGPDWAGPWITNAVDRFIVAPGGSPAGGASPGDPDQHLQMFGATSSSYKAERPMDPWTGDFVFEFDAKYTLAGPLVATQQIQFENTSGSTTGKRPLNIKWEANGLFRVNDQNMLTFNGLSPGFANMLADWVTVRIVCDWETATFDLYWSNDSDGALAYVGSKVGWRDADFAGSVQKLRVDAPKVNLATDGLELDRITLVPEPVSAFLLVAGVGMLSARTRRRAR